MNPQKKQKSGSVGQTDRQTETQTDTHRQTETQTQIQTHTHTHTETQRHTNTHTQIHTQTHTHGGFLFYFLRGRNTTLSLRREGSPRDTEPTPVELSGSSTLHECDTSC